MLVDPILAKFSCYITLVFAFWSAPVLSSCVRMDARARLDQGALLGSRAGMLAAGL